MALAEKSVGRLALSCIKTSDVQIAADLIPLAEDPACRRFRLQNIPLQNGPCWKHIPEFYLRLRLPKPRPQIKLSNDVIKRNKYIDTCAAQSL